MQKWAEEVKNNWANISQNIQILDEKENKVGPYFGYWLQTKYGEPNNQLVSTQVFFTTGDNSYCIILTSSKENHDNDQKQFKNMLKSIHPKEIKL